MQKRSFKPTVTGSSSREGSFLNYKDLKEGSNVYGEYLSMFETINSKKQKQPNFKIRVIEANFKAPIEAGGVPQDLTGKVVIFNGAGALNKFMEGVQKGMHVDIEYAGKQKGSDPKDTQMYHTFSKLEAGFPDDGKEAATSGGRNAL